MIAGYPGRPAWHCGTFRALKASLGDR